MTNRATIPDGFRYSNAARRECKRLADRANKLLKTKCRQDKAFCARLTKIMENNIWL